MNAVTIVLAVLVFGLLIFIHELGHFLAAKWAGMQVNEFAMGMGPALFKFQKGETQFSLRMFPIGGYCAVEGENEESPNPRSFGNIKLYKRILFVVAGAAMNLLLGLIILGCLSSQAVAFATTTIDTFYEGAISDQQLQAGDQILRMNNHRIRSANDISYQMMRDRDGIMDILVRRDGQDVLLEQVQFHTEDFEGITVMMMDFRVEYDRDVNPLKIIRHTFDWTGSMIKQVWGSFIDLITGRYSVNHLSGPVGVTKAIGEIAAEDEVTGMRDWYSVIIMVAMITINLGVFNLLPIPALDGGRLLFLLVELVRRKPVSAKYEGWVHAVGFLLLISLMIFVTFNDIVNLIKG